MWIKKQQLELKVKRFIIQRWHWLYSCAWHFEIQVFVQLRLGFNKENHASPSRNLTDVFWHPVGMLTCNIFEPCAIVTKYMNRYTNQLKKVT